MICTICSSEILLSYIGSVEIEIFIQTKWINWLCTELPRYMYFRFALYHAKRSMRILVHIKWNDLFTSDTNQVFLSLSHQKWIAAYLIYKLTSCVSTYRQLSHKCQHRNAGLEVISLNDGICLVSSFEERMFTYALSFGWGDTVRPKIWI